MSTILELAKRADRRVKYRIFRGEFESGAPAVWATADVHTTGGPVEGRILGTPRVRRSISREYGAAPERCSVSLLLGNADDALRELLVGTTSASVVAEYGGDSFLALIGHLYVGYIDDDGTTVEQKISPELRCSGIDISGDTVRLSLVSHDDKHVGSVSRAFTVRSLREATFVAAGDESWLGAPALSAGSFDSTAFAAMQRRMRDDLDAFIPFAYGYVDVPCGVFDEGEEWAHGFLFASSHKPDLSDAALEYVEALHRDGQIFRGSMRVWSVRASVRNDADVSFGSTNVWICGFSARPVEDEDQPAFVAFGAQRNRLSMSADFTSTGVQSSSPTEVARALLYDLSTAGSLGVDATSFARAHGALNTDLCGVVAGGGATVAEYLQLLGGWCGLLWWVGTDDKVHVQHANAWADADVAAAAGDLPELRWGAEIFAAREIFPSSPNEVGGLATKLGWRWSSTQQRLYPNLRRRAPSTPVAITNQAIEAQVRGDAVSPLRAALAGTIAAQARSEIRRTIELVCRDWIALYDLGQIIRVTHPLALGTGAARGYDRRLFRILEIEDGEDDSVTVRAIDCAALAELKPATWPALADWTQLDPAGSGATLELKPGGTGNRATASSALFTTAMVGSHLLTPGAANAGNYKIARRITGLVGGSPSTTVTVDEVFTDTETLAAVPALTDPIAADWLVVWSQATQSPPNTTELTACNEATGLFRDGATPGFQATGG